MKTKYKENMKKILKAIIKFGTERNIDLGFNETYILKLNTDFSGELIDSSGNYIFSFLSKKQLKNFLELDKI